MRHQSIAIIGAGFSGTMLALHLRRRCPGTTAIRLIDTRAAFGTGVAYATTCPDHLLNVPAGRMSAFPDQPAHFMEWLERQPEASPRPQPRSFVPRALYGQYTRELLVQAVGGLEPMHRRVVAIGRERGLLSLHFAEGSPIDADIVVLATGNDPASPPHPALADSSVYRNNPWAFDTFDDLPRESPVLLIGSGLTMVDMALSLLARGHTGPIHAVSRRGLLPHRHATSQVPAGFDLRDIPRRPPELLRFLRLEAERVAGLGGSWHAVVDMLRPITQEIWRDWTMTERRRFLAHARAWWDTHRHRMPPAVADRIVAARAGDQLRIHTGRIAGVITGDRFADVVWQPRGGGATEVIRAERIVNCTGPASDVTASADPLVCSLLAGGFARPDPLRLGFDVAADGSLRGNASDILFGVGPICRSALWENTAVPDIRVQCEALSGRIAETIRCRDEPEWHSTPHAAISRIPGLWF